MYAAINLKVQFLGKSLRKASVPDLEYDMDVKKQYFKKVGKNVQVVIDVEAKKVIVEEIQHAIEPNTIGQFTFDAGITMSQTDLEILGEWTACLKENNLTIGTKWIVSHMPTILFVESIQFENVASLLVEEEGEFNIHGLERFNWVRQIRVFEVVFIAVNIYELQ